MKPPKIIIDLIEKFERNAEAYKSGKYNETQLRREFLDPFFKALGWDITNKMGVAEQYKEVIHEDSIKIDGTNKAPDYSFRIGNQRKFFVEAKKPSVNIKDDIHPAYQIRRYAWSAKLPLSILTDFDEFAVYDCRFKPNPSDKASVGRIMYFTYADLNEKWNDIYSIFSRESVWQGSFDKYADDNDKKRGTSEVDEEFLKELERWRELLAKNIALRNKSLSNNELNYAVQRTLDRILFFRISEDRGLEEQIRLASITNDKSIYNSLCTMFLEADDKYNSGLFHFHNNNDRPTPPDELSLDLNIDNKILIDIISNLYYPKCPYEFSVMPVEILGQVYERFLGKEIKLLKGNRVIIVEKPLVKKAGGVFYTPSYIVDKITDEVMSKYLKNKTPKQVEKLTILDPACGSGTFLLGAYEYLTKWHIDYYLKKPTKSNKSKLIQTSNKEWKLTSKEKKKILLNNIYGVDIDAQAVETTKLSLSLKVLEGETNETINKQLSLFKEQALPDIGNNIKCGNSLVGFDIDLKDVTEEERYKINPFDWKNEFKKIFNSPDKGFNIIIGNPPYLRVQGLNEFHGNEIAYYTNKFKTAIKRFDMYLLFIEKSFHLLANTGVLGFICPHKFINSDFGSGIRQFLSETKSIFKMVSFDYNLIFKNATTYTCLLYLTKKQNRFLKFTQLPELKEGALKNFLITLKEKDYNKIDIKSLSKEKWSLSSDNSINFLENLCKSDNIGVLEDFFVKITQGIVTGNDDTHLLKLIKRKTKNLYICFSKAINSNIEIESDLLKVCLIGKTVKKYDTLLFDDYCIFPYKNSDGKTVIIEENEFKNKYPLGYNYLKQFKKQLTIKKIKYKTNSKYWYSLHRSRDISTFEQLRVITPEISFHGNFRIAKVGTYHNAKVYSLIPKSTNKFSPYFWMALLNSNFMWWYLCKTGYVLRGGYSSYATKYISSFPTPNNLDKNKEIVTQIEKQSRELENIISSLTKTKSPPEKELLERRLKKTEENINNSIYMLYNFSKEELEHIESTMRLAIAA